jgi:IMP dehydrogenase
VVVDPVTVHPDQKLAAALELMRRFNISGLPVVDESGRAVGILTNRDIRFEKNLDQRVRDVMTTKLITAAEGMTLEQSKVLLHKNRIEKLIIIDPAGKLRGLVTIKDIERAQQHPQAAKDDLGRLRVGAAVGVGADREARVEALIAAGVDGIVLATAHGHSKGVIDAVAATRRAFPKLQMVAGNVATAEATVALIKAGVDAVKVGIGPARSAPRAWSPAWACRR